MKTDDLIEGVREITGLGRNEYNQRMVDNLDTLTCQCVVKMANEKLKPMGMLHSCEIKEDEFKVRVNHGRLNQVLDIEMLQHEKNRRSLDMLAHIKGKLHSEKIEKLEAQGFAVIKETIELQVSFTRDHVALLLGSVARQAELECSLVDGLLKQCYTYHRERSIYRMDDTGGPS